MNNVFYVKEKNSYQLTFNFVDEQLNKVSKSAIASLFCTQYYFNPEIGASDKYHLATINHRSNQDVFDANNVTISTSGTVTWLIQPEDTIKLNSNTDIELHVVLFTWKWGSLPMKKNSEEVILSVRKIPYAY